MYASESDASLRRMLALPWDRGGFGKQRLETTFNLTLEDLQRWRDSAPRPTHRSPNCAVVGSSGALLRSSNGAEIDRAHWVFRVNNAPTDARVRAHVGSRTTFSVNTFPNMRPVRGRREAAVPQRGAAPARGTPTLIYYCHVPRLTRCWTNADHDRQHRVSPALVEDTKRDLGISRGFRWPSTGAVAIALAMRMCRTTTVYGFGGDPASQSCARYYRGSAIGCAPRSPPWLPLFGDQRRESEDCQTYRPEQAAANASGHDDDGGKGCTTLREYLSPRHGYHDWVREAEWLASLARKGGDVRVVGELFKRSHLPKEQAAQVKPKPRVKRAGWARCVRGPCLKFIK